MRCGQAWLLAACLPLAACRVMSELHDPYDSFPTADDVPRETRREEGAAVDAQALERLLSEELPQEERGLENAVVEAEGELEEARLRVRIAEVEGRAGIRRAEEAPERN